MHRGWIKLWRKIEDNDLWLSEKFTRGQAWVDLIMLANHKPGYIRKRGIRVDIERGQLGWSEVRLSKRWRWSRGKVHRFLLELASGKEPFIVQQKSKITTLISITNYKLYQPDDTTNSTTDGHQTDIKQYSNKNEKNVKNKKNKDLRASDFELFYSSYPKKKAKPDAKKAWDQAIKKKVLPDIEIILDAISKQYPQGKDPQFIKLPAGWLRHERWGDEPDKEKGVGTQHSFNKNDYGKTEEPGWMKDQGKEDKDNGNS